MDELDDQAPGAAFEVFLQNGLLMDKLACLNFEKEFLQKQRGIRTISKVTFALQNKENQGEQFTQFLKLAQYLLQSNGVNMEVDEFDDPGTLISQLMESCRRVGISVDFPSSKLRPGFGHFVVTLLNNLADAALESRRHKWRSPVYPDEQDEPETTMDESDPEMEMEDEADQVDSDDDQAMLELNELGLATHAESEMTKVSDLPTIDPEAWKEEVERLAPQLKITLRGDQKNWRQRIDALKQSKEQIESVHEETLKKLNLVADEIGVDLDKTKSRERHINQQMANQITELRTANDKLAGAKEHYQSQTSGIASKADELSQISAELELIKAEMEERGQAISDSKPLGDAKRAMGELQRDNCQLDVRIATIEHELNTLRLTSVH